MRVIATILVILINSLIAMGSNLEKATFGGGCFWCTEAVYLELKGISTVMPGYSGGHVKNPTYEQVCAETTGHAEVIQIEYDPSVISYSEILEVFFLTHDPTTINKQGNDVGTQYRSVVFYHNEEQMKVINKVIELFERENVYPKPIVTQVEAFNVFYPAEDYHVNYYARNKTQGYCQFVIAPKMEKFRKVFKERLK